MLNNLLRNINKLKLNIEHPGKVIEAYKDDVKIKEIREPLIGAFSAIKDERDKIEKEIKKKDSEYFKIF